MPPASGAASSRFGPGAGAGPDRLQPDLGPADDGAIAADHRGEVAALGPELPGQSDVDRRRAHGDPGAGEAGDGEPGVGAREGVAAGLGEIDASGRLAAEAEARREER